MSKKLLKTPLNPTLAKEEPSSEATPEQSSAGYQRINEDTSRVHNTGSRLEANMPGSRLKAKNARIKRLNARLKEIKAKHEA